MSELFTRDWAQRYKAVWNGPEGIAQELSAAGFNSVVAFGLDNEEEPRCVLIISNGQVVTAGPPNGEKVIWDLRADADEWKKLLEKPPGLMKLGLGNAGAAPRPPSSVVDANDRHPTVGVMRRLPSPAAAQTRFVSS